jgi:hypothetical protein
MNSNAFCTIITPSHLAYALALNDSLHKNKRDAFDMYVLLACCSYEFEFHADVFPALNFIFIDEICDEGIGKALFEKYYPQYIDEFRWSMKPVFINYLLQKNEYDKVIYTDSDIHFYNDYQFLIDELNVSNVLITPHWRASNPHIDLPNFELLYTSGIYNGGFIGANRKAIEVMEWWAKVCKFICVKDSKKGMFVDQVHLNLLPVYFEKIGILKHRGCNVSNWNMVECKRTIAQSGTDLQIQNSYPIVFVHFSKSTIDGISSGVDSLLMPHLMQYYLSINKYLNFLGMPELNISKIHNEVHPIKKVNLIMRIKTLFHKFIL